VASLDNRVHVWNVHETAEKALRLHTYADFYADYDAVDKDLRDLKQGLGNAALKAKVEQDISDLTAKVGNAAEKAKVDQDIGELMEKVGNAAVKIEIEKQVSDFEELVNNGLNDIWAELDQRPTQQDLNQTLEDLYTRIMTELRPKSPNPSNEPTTNGNDVVTPKLPDPNPPMWMTYSHKESQEMVADALNMSLSQLISYNNAYLSKMDTKSQSFWSAPPSSANAVEKATVLIPVADEIPPTRILLTRVSLLRNLLPTYNVFQSCPR
jgi:hypothetical protein